MYEDRKNIRIVDIAKMAEVSPGTVDRVLHNRGKVSPDKREKVEKVLKEINYEPNIIARSLALKRYYKIIVLIPSFGQGSYWDMLNHGITRAANELVNFNINVQYLYFDQYNVNSFAYQSRILLDSEFDGILMASLFTEPVIEFSKALDSRGIPYVYIDSNIPDQNNLAYFGTNSYDGGIVAAKLMMYDVGIHADILIANIRTNNKKDSSQTYTREKGFRDYLSKNGYAGKIYEVELFDNHAETLTQINHLIESNSNLLGGVVFNSRIYELVAMLTQNSEKSHGMKLIGYDAIERNMETLRQNKVSFLLSQRSDMQGYNGVKALSNYLLFGRKAEKTNYMPIDILICENIEYYNNL